MSERAPESPTIVDRLRTAARDGGGALVFHDDDGARRLDAAELYQLALARAGRLAALGVEPGVCVGVIGPNAPDWIAWSYAVWMRGATLVPLPAPLRVRDREAVSAQLTALATGFDCSVIAAHEKFAPLLPADVTIDWRDEPSAISPLADSGVVEPDAQSLAMIVPTSGSTSAPKGVARTYDAVNRMALPAMVNPGDDGMTRHLSYSPLAHAGGNLAVYAPVEPWLEFHLLSAARFARDPGELFRLVAPNALTALFGASSGIAAATRSIERNADGVDLSTLRWLCFCFEMVDPAVLDHLTDVGARVGLDPGAIGSYYGLSEGGGTGTRRGFGIPVDEIDLDAFVESGIAQAPRPGAPIKRVPSCGVPFGELRIAGPDGPVPERHAGEVQFRTADLMRGYVGPGAEPAIDDEGWLHTGDVGYLADGEVYVTGRLKEVLIQHGKKYHPEDIEQVAASIAGVAADECVAFTSASTSSPGEIVVAIETAHADDRGVLEQRVRAAITNALGISVRTVVFVKPQSLPKTASGKAQRLTARDRHANGELEMA